MIRLKCIQDIVKFQVSKCEKFGYGYMVTQVAATAPGMHALEKAGNVYNDFDYYL